MRAGLSIGAVTLLIIVLRDITVLGKYIGAFALPTFSAIKLIDVGDVLTRLEIVYAVVLIILLFFKVSTVYYATVSGVGSLLGTVSYRWLIYVFGAMIVLYAQISFRASAEQGECLRSAAATYSAFFLLGLPLLTQIVSWLRGRPKDCPEAQQEAV
jgi:spore germination protein KB